MKRPTPAQLPPRPTMTARIVESTSSTGATIYTVETMPADQDHWAYGAWDPYGSRLTLAEAQQLAREVAS
jgi:hypothetical protein